MDTSRAMSAFIECNQELADQVSANLADVRCAFFQAELGEGIELLAIKLDGAAGQVARTAGMQVDADPLAQIVGLVNFRLGDLVRKVPVFIS